LSWDNPSASPMVPWRCSFVCNTLNKLWVETTPRPHLWHPDVTQMHVKHNGNIELRQCFSLTHGPLISLRCMPNAIWALRWDTPLDSLIVPWCRLNACKTHYEHSLETIARPHLWYSDVFQTRAQQYKHWAGTIPWPHFMVPWCRSNACKTQYKPWVETIPRPHLWYPDVAQAYIKDTTNIQFRQSLGLTYGTLISLKYV